MRSLFIEKNRALIPGRRNETISLNDTESPGQILVTGATGQIGSELIAVLSRKHGKQNIVAAGHSRSPSERTLSLANYETLDVTKKEEVSKIVHARDFNTIYHLAGVLSASGEKDPARGWAVNMDGLRNVLEVARERGVPRIFWASSIAVFGSNAPRVRTPQEASLIPTTVYGICKVAGELLCNYYTKRYGLDIRSLRYPGIISSETPAGGGTTDYAVEIFYDAIKKKRYTCFVRKDTILPMLYMPDCMNATMKLMDADPSRIKIRTSYNLGGLTFTAEELANEIKKYVPGFVCEYKPDFRQNIADSWPQSLDDTPARKDWGWEPEYDLGAMTKDMFEKLSKRLGYV
jgi:nucleoside-diphosphate-sugar epimerase